MTETLEGSLVLELLETNGLREQFYEAIDSDDFKKMRQLMNSAGIDLNSIESVMNQTEEDTKDTEEPQSR